MPKIRKWLKKRLYQPAFTLKEKAVSIPAAQYDEVSEQQLVPYDENLLEQSRTQWQLGDWASLANLNRDTLQHHPDRAKLALLAAAGQIQSSNAAAAQQFVRLAQDWGCSKRMVSQVLVSGVFSTLGKATLWAGDRQRALEHYKTAAAVANQRINSNLLAETQVMHETVRLEASLQAAAMTSPSLPAPVKPDIGITTYAQNFEDVMLWRALGRIQNGFYIDVGAHHPVEDSVSKAFYEHGWRGIHVEPLAEYAEALRKDRPDERVIEFLLSTQANSRTFYRIPNTGLSTGTKEFATRHQNSGWEVNEIEVPTTTLSSIFFELGDRPIHWLKIDVEGMEAEVLASWDSHPARPWILVVEATEPGSQIPNWQKWEPLVLGMGYEYVYFDGLNRFYISGQHRELIPLFSTPPNIFDGFRKN